MDYNNSKLKHNNEKCNYVNKYNDKFNHDFHDNKNIRNNNCKYNDEDDFTNGCEDSENTDLVDKIYKSGKLLEKSKYLTTLNLNLEMDFKDLYNQQGKEVMKYIQPIIEKLSKKEHLLEELTSKAREYISEYKKNGEILNKTIEKYKVKKIKLNKLIDNVSCLRREIKEKDIQNIEKEKFLLNKENQFNEKSENLEKDKMKFNKYLEQKTHEILSEAENLKDESSKIKFITDSFDHKEIDLKQRTKTLEKKEAELQKKLQNFESDKYDFDIKKREFDLNKEEFNIYSQDVIKKYEELKFFKNNYEEEKNKLIQYESILNEKDKNYVENEKKITLTITDIESKNKEIGKKHQILAEREKEIEQMKILLQEKISQYSQKVEEAEKIQERLKDKENILVFKGDVEKEIELKLTGLELNETINKKKIEAQKKLLSEEISKRFKINKLAKEIVKGGENNKGGFSKLINSIKGNSNN